MTSTYDHRVIQGAESGAFLRRIDQLLQGEDGFYERRLRRARRGPDAAPRARRRRRRSPPPSPVPAAATPAAAPVADAALLQAVQAATSLVKAHRMHGHLAARLDPLGSEPVGRPGARPRHRRPHRRADARASRRRCCAWRCRARPSPTRCPTCARPTAARSPTRSSTSPTTSSASGCARRSSRARYRQPLDAEDKRCACSSACRRSRRSRATCTRPSSARSSSRSRASTRSCRCSTRRSSWPPAPGAREVVLGMAHRGRLNVLAHTVGRPYETILVEFEGEQTLDVDTATPEGGTGDVKYHHGASRHLHGRERARRDGHAVAQPEPPRVSSNPVIEGRARADQTSRKARELDARPDRGAAGPDPRRRRLPRPGRRVRDAQPAGARRATPPAARST